MNDVPRHVDLPHTPPGVVTVTDTAGRTRARAVGAPAIVAKEFTKIEEQFTAEMKAALPSGRLAAIWTGLQTQAGTFKGSDRMPGS